MTTFCTLFDHNYLDKGLALYESLERVCSEFELYVLCMSDRCYDILTDLNYTNLKPIRLEDFEDEELLRVKPTRGIGEYCWTCSSSLIKYVLETFNPNYCTYVDADMFFYSDPKVIIEEMKAKGASAQIISHRFPKKTAVQQEQIVGKYCVEFDTFKNDENGLMLVNLWRRQCLEHCSADCDGIYYGDQKYQDSWCEDYEFCIETDNLGAGLGPWNYLDYKYEGEIEGTPMVSYKGTITPLVFYHFENIVYVEKHLVKLNLYNNWGVSPKLARVIYPKYLKCVDKAKDLLYDKYGLKILITTHPGYDWNNKHRKLTFKSLVNNNPLNIIKSLIIRLKHLYYRNDIYMRF